MASPNHPYRDKTGIGALQLETLWRGRIGIDRGVDVVLAGCQPRRPGIEPRSRIKRNETMNQASAGKAERKISETILDFGGPLLSEAITEDTPIAVVRETYKLVVLVWNAHVAATARWGDPSYLQMLRQMAAAPQMPPQGRACIETLSRRWREKFSDAKYCVGEWHVRIKHDDTLSFLCDAREAPRR